MNNLSVVNEQKNDKTSGVHLTLDLLDLFLDRPTVLAQLELSDLSEADVLISDHDLLINNLCEV